MAGGELSLGRQTAPESGPQTWGYDPRRDLCSWSGATQRNKDFLFFFARDHHDTKRNLPGPLRAPMWGVI